MKWPPNEPAPYYRLVIHLARLWDYSSCSEAMLKTWLARHLLAEANPDCAMWSKAAAKNAVGAADEWSAGDMAAAAAAGLKPLGPYSCSLAEAGWCCTAVFLLCCPVLWLPFFLVWLH